MHAALGHLCEMTSSVCMSDDDGGREFDSLRQLLRPHGQEHVLDHWPRLTPQQRRHLADDVRATDWHKVSSAFRDTLRNRESQQQLDQLIEPLPGDLHQGVDTCTQEQLRMYREAGLRAVSEGRVAALLLAGGQGTRLGVPYPKGMFDVGLPSRKTLYQLQGERLLRLQRLAKQLTGKSAAIPWYLMTSEHTLEPTAEFFARHGHFGLRREDVFMFEQFMLPCLDREGKAMLEEPHRIAKAPDGNGGLFRALQERGVLADMSRRGVEYVHVYCVDNILVKMADPVFIGYCISKGANCAAKVVEKNSPDEAVGVVCRVAGHFQVVEYSEISPETASRRTSDGRLEFNAGNICNHLFRLDFLQQIGSGNKCLKYHVAQKKIPYVGADGKTVNPLKPNGIKLEKFVFDVFEFSNHFVAWNVLRETEFSPLKNADGAAKDTPSTARRSLYALHKGYIAAAGGKFAQENGHSHMNGCANGYGENTNGTNGDCAADEDVYEISPLVSYDGEGLEDLVSGKSFSSPTVISAPDECIPVAQYNGGKR